MGDRMDQFKLTGKIAVVTGASEGIGSGLAVGLAVKPGRISLSAAGVSHLTEALAMEWASSGIRVNALAPTAVMTPSRKHILQGEVLKKILSRIPLGRLATPDDLVNAAIYLACPASDFVTGHTLLVDGGWVAAS